MPPVVLIISSVFLGVAGQLVLKTGVSNIGPLALGKSRLSRTVLSLFMSPAIGVGLALYGVGTFFWLVALSQVALGYAYPFISLSYIFILLASWWLFNEEISPVRIVGVVAICLGVYAVASG